MDTTWKTSLWLQFGAAIDMLDSAMGYCPDELWHATLFDSPDEEPEYNQVWFLVYHTLFWLDLYLSGYSEGFTPPAPFIRGRLPEKPYTKDEVHAYLEHGRRKCQATIEALTDERARQRCEFDWVEASFLELQLYNMRHVQEHAAQLNFWLGQHGIPVNDWITKAENKAA